MPKMEKEQKIIKFCTPGQRIAVAMRLLIYYLDFLIDFRK